MFSSGITLQAGRFSFSQLCEVSPLIFRTPSLLWEVSSRFCGSSFKDAVCFSCCVGCFLCFSFSRLFLFAWLCQVSAATSPAGFSFLVWFLLLVYADDQPSPTAGQSPEGRHSYGCSVYLRRAFPLWNVFHLDLIASTVLWCHIYISVYIPLKNMTKLW